MAGHVASVRPQVSGEVCISGGQRVQTFGVYQGSAADLYEPEAARLLQSPERSN
jgi:hypothetical protein